MLLRARRTTKNDTIILSDSGLPVVPEHQTLPRTGALTPPWRLLMQIGGDHQTTVGLEVKDRIMMGRADPLADYQPDFDLTPYGGKENGVSRRHAAITREENGLYVEALQAVNGTRINGVPLDTGQRSRLRDGDEIALGRLRIVVRFVRSPF
jgi:hypothetical protein